MSFLSNIGKKTPSIELTEVQRLTQAIAAGSLSARADVSTASGDAQALLVAVNELLDAALLPIGEGNRVLRLLSGGNLRERVEIECKGDHLRMKEAINGVHALLRDLVGVRHSHRQRRYDRHNEIRRLPTTKFTNRWCWSRPTSASWWTTVKC